MEYLLRDRRNESPDILTESEKKVREAFDAFLSFLVKLEYLVSVKILDDNELDYFSYFIRKAAEQEEVTNFMKVYEFPLRGKLDQRLKVLK